MRRLIWIALTMSLWPLAAIAECGGADLLARLAADDPAAHAALFERARDKANGQGKFWRVNRPGVAPSYLFGTFHNTGIARQPLDPAVAAALGQARLMLVEVTLAEQARMQKRIQTDPAFVFADGGNGVIELLSADERAAATPALADMAIGVAVAGKLHRWLLFSALAVPFCLQEDMRAGQPLLDNLLSAKAERAGIPGKMSGSCASRIAGASSWSCASVPGRSSTPIRRPRRRASWSPRPMSQNGAGPPSIRIARFSSTRMPASASARWAAVGPAPRSWALASCHQS